MNEGFDILVAKALAGEASAEEQARLGELLSQNPEFEREFEELRSSWNSLREVGPLAEAMEAPPAFIPSERLAQLQEAVRKKVAGSPDAFATGASVHEEANSSCDRRRGITGSRQSPTQLGNEAGEYSPLGAVKRWLRERIGLSPLGASIGMVVLAFLVGGVLFLRRSSQPLSADNGSPEVVAYLVPDQGKLEVRRDGKLIALRATTPLRGSDEVLLATGTKAYLVTAAGELDLVGPKRLIAGKEAGRGPARIEKPRSGQLAFAGETNALQVALFRPAREIRASGLVVTTRGRQSIPLYSPLGSTAMLTPLILWKSEPGKTYEITISDEFDSKAAPLRLSGVVPPVDFAKVEAWKGRTLAKDGLYRITLSETGKPLSACESTFRTLKSADASTSTAPAEKLIRAYRILTAEPSRVGDALAELLTLPPVFAESELALRLKLYAFGEQGYKEDFEHVAVEIRSRDPSR